MKKWNLEIEKNGNVIISKSDNGVYNDKSEAIKQGRKIAKDNKSILKIQLDKSKQFHIEDYSNILSPQQWVNKLESQVKVSKAEFMIAKTRIIDTQNKLKKAKKDNDLPSVNSYKERLKDAKLKLRKAKMNYKNVKKRLKQSKKNS